MRWRMPIKGLFTADRSFDYHTFKYKITRSPAGLEVNFTLSPLRLAKPFLWAVLFGMPGALVLRWFGANTWSVLFATPSLGIAALLLIDAIFSARCTTMWLLTTEIKVRKGVFGLGKVRAFPIAETRSFGIGAFGHLGIPVLKFEVGKEWITLVGGNDLEVDDFLRDLEAHGWKAPQ